MTARQHAWADTPELGRRGELVLDAAFGPEYIIVIATRHHQRQNIDRFFVHRRDGRLVYRVDYKCDEAAGRTGNLALEHVSVVRKGRREVAGWLHTTAADLRRLLSRDGGVYLKRHNFLCSPAHGILWIAGSARGAAARLRATCDLEATWDLDREAMPFLMGPGLHEG